MDMVPHKSFVMTAFAVAIGLILGLAGYAAIRPYLPVGSVAA
jgi:hypothetical protein